MQQWELTKENLDTVRGIAKEWEQGVIILKPFDGDFVFIAVTRVNFYSPSDNIHHTTVSGKDITLAVSQKLSTTNMQGRSPITTHINGIDYEDIWELPSSEKFVWLKLRQRS